MTFFLAILLSASGLLPPAIHQLRMKSVEVDPGNAVKPQNLPEITIFIPARDEGKLLEKKLLNVVESDYSKSKIRLLIVDSGSIDGTGDIARKFLSNKADEISWEVLSLEKPGKSLAVNKALEIIDTDFFVMTDVDSFFSSDSIKIAISRLVSDSTIGAICGRKSTGPKDSMTSYRKKFNELRISESILDSTPIFEGSFCAFRTSSVSEGIDSSINADDTQLALLSIRNGFRSVMDPKLEFTEPESNFLRDFRRSIRRAQGISRCFVANRDLRKLDRPFRSFFYHSFYFYVIFPWIIFVSSALAVWSSSMYISANSYPYFFPTTLLIFFLITIFFRPVRDFLIGILVLLISHGLTILRVDLSTWRPIR